MSVFLYKFFHNQTKDRTENGLVNVPIDKVYWPDSWKRVYYKKYLNFLEIKLPRINGYLFENFLKRRRSSSSYLNKSGVSFEDLSYILKCGYGLQDEVNERQEGRVVPSAGGVYPLELYVFALKKQGILKSGVYHYNVIDHSLEPVYFIDFSEKEVALISSMSWVHDAHLMVCVTSVLDGVVHKYGSRGYRYILIEAGHVAQNIILAGVERGVNVIPAGGVNDENIENIIGLQGSDEKAIYSLFI